MRSLTFRARSGQLELGGRTALMGVVNVTPDSFHAASRRPDVEAAVETALERIEQGAEILDLGGESTRPGAFPVSEEEEIRRVVPVVARLRPRIRALISIDTRKAGVAERALAEGADMVNDVSALADPRMAEVVAEAGAGIVLMHMQGTPETMQRNPRYADVVAEVREHLREALRRAEASGIDPESVLVDPGIGFGKSLAHNLTLLNRLTELQELGRPVLVGPSRKGFLGHLLQETVENRIWGTAASVACAVLRGAQVLRVHDVREMRQVCLVADAIRNEEAKSR